VGLFKARFEKEVDLLVDLPENLMQVRVPALILQPLVENALVHALPRCNGIFRLRISAGLTDGHIEIRVSDNGPGLLRSKLNAISGSLKMTGPAGKLTGLNGLNWRLRYYYPDSASVRLEQAGDGLTVVVELPSQEQGKSPEKL
jgi:two-component system sensor histidine kinase YesM